LLDWVGQGLYGLARPVLPSNANLFKGPWNTFLWGSRIAWGELLRIGPATYYATNDDIYRRVLTWHFWKGDGKYFDIRWLKRRVMRFLTGTNGTAGNTDTTYQVSIQFGVGNQATIILYNGRRLVTGGSMYNRFLWGSRTPWGSLRTTHVQYAPLTYAMIFQAAVNAGILELPFQFQWSVEIVN
jgi:hypothetical protein